MQTRFANYTIPLNKLCCLIIILLLPVLCFGIPKLTLIPLDRNFMHLPDGRWMWLHKIDMESTEIIVGSGEKSLKNKIWSVIKSGTEDEGTWDYAYFIYFKPNVLWMDLNNDNYPEVAIATYDNGNLVEREVLIYTVKPNSVEFYKEEGPYNLEWDLPLDKLEPVF